MNKNKIIFVLLLLTLMAPVAYCQEKPESLQIKNIAGTVLSTDSAGNTISIQTDDQRQMAFYVPDKAIITQETHNIGLMDIEKSDSVTMRYYISPSSQYTVVSIVDNKSVVNE